MPTTDEEYGIIYYTDEEWLDELEKEARLNFNMSAYEALEAMKTERPCGCCGPIAETSAGTRLRFNAHIIINAHKKKESK